MNETIPLGEIVEIKGGGTPSRSVEEYWDGSYPMGNCEGLQVNKPRFDARKHHA